MSQQMQSDEMPTGWKLVRLGQHAHRPEYGYTVSAMTEPVGPKLLRITDIQDHGVDWETVPYCDCDEAVVKRYLLRPGDLIVSRIGATTGKAYLISECPEVIFASYLIRIRPKADLAPEFLYYFLQGERYWNQIERSRGGRLKGGVNIPILEGLELPLPTLPEQHAIAHILRAVQAAREARQREVSLERERKAALMAHLFTHGTRGEPTKQTPIGEMPVSWEVKTVGEVVKALQYGLSVRGETTGGYPMFRMNNLEEGYVVARDMQYVDLEDGEFRKFRLRIGDILFNRTNSADLVGKSGLFSLEGDYVFASYLVRLIPGAHGVIPEYLNHFLNWDASLQRLRQLATRGVSQSNISAGKLEGSWSRCHPFQNSRQSQVRYTPATPKSPRWSRRARCWTSCSARCWRS